MALFLFNLKETLCRRNIIIFSAFVLIALLLVQTGIPEYRIIRQELLDFQAAEPQKANLDVPNSGIEPAYLYFMPSAMCVFFNAPGVLKRTRAAFNDNGYLDVSAPLLGGSAFESLFTGFMNYSGFLLYMGSLLTLLLGWDAVRNRQYLRTLSGIAGSPVLLFMTVVFSRLLVLMVLTKLLGFAASILALQNGLQLSDGDLSQFSRFNWSAAAIFAFFLLMGMITGSFASKARAVTALLGTWFFFLFLVPGVMGKYISSEAQRSFPYQHTVKEPSDILGSPTRGGLTVPEQRAIQTADRTDRYVGIKRLIDGPLADQIERFMLLSMLCPTTAYMARGNELSSRGYSGLYSFYTAAAIAQSVGKDNRKNAALSPKAIPISREDRIRFKTLGVARGRIFYSTSWMPPALKANGLVRMIYLLFLVPLALTAFIRAVNYRNAKQSADTSHLTLELETGQTRLFNAPKDFVYLVYNTLGCEHKGVIKGEVLVDGERLEPTDINYMTYLPNPASFPANLKVRTLANAIKTLAGLSKKEREAVNNRLKDVLKKRFNVLDADTQATVLVFLVSHLKREFYILEDFVKNMSLKGIRNLEEQLTQITAAGASILYFNHLPTYTPPIHFQQRHVVRKSEGRYQIDKLI